MSLSDVDLTHLRQCVDLARDGLEAGDEPFGSVLVDGAGAVRFADRNRVQDGDQTRHPEFDAAKWAAQHLPADERGACTVYTSGEHCAMCSAAHAWVGLGRIVYAVSTEQLVGWLRAGACRSARSRRCPSRPSPRGSRSTVPPRSSSRRCASCTGLPRERRLPEGRLGSGGRRPAPRGAR